ncbi:hypothetical protein NX722_14730 [Endozoicomonas gorgoniicola]|uniref:t-SNARE coiled-coil homology domain-containing protein n=1 Tax=Endozoicomonas gorgoniicola TaxID=1234144 RepID=A0ABT3MXQ6_9GAMM|nr:hypothetical protein [Endozoicomonas gorgoniicola]MCW7553858.1 hypothetical protein [Endozoicomonas gorgoniicola]
MGLEARVERLESHFDSLDSAIRSLITITGETHQVVLENQRENRLRFQQIDNRFDQQERRMDKLESSIDKLESSINVLADATLAGFKRSDEQHEEARERFDQLELLIRQSFPKN